MASYMGDKLINYIFSGDRIMSTAEKTVTRPITRLTHLQLANTLVNRFKGFVAIDEEIGSKIGKRFASISFRKPMKMRKNHRTERDDNNKKVVNPFLEKGVFEVGKLLLDLNAIWENSVNNKADRVAPEGSVGYVANEKRSNGILNYCDSRVVCHKEKDGIETFYVNYIVGYYIGDTVYVDGDGETLNYADLAEYHQKTSYNSKKKEADKHGLSVDNDVQIRQMKMENITMLSIFGVDYVPTESATVKVDTKSPVAAIAHA